MWPHSPASIPSPQGSSISSWTVAQNELFHPEVAFVGTIVLVTRPETDAQDSPENTLFWFVSCIYIIANNPSDIPGSFKSGLGQPSTYFSVSVCLNWPLGLLYSELRFLPSFQGPPFFPAVWAGTTAQLSFRQQPDALTCCLIVPCGS